MNSWYKTWINDRQTCTSFSYELEFLQADSFFSCLLSVTEGVGPRLPAAGGIYNTRFWALLTNCKGYQSGLYEIKLQKHNLQLSLIEDWNCVASPLLGSDLGSIFLLACASISDYSFKYAQYSESLASMNAGVFLYHCYIVASSFGLGVRPIGYIDHKEFCRLTLCDDLSNSVLYGAAFGWPA
jgi:SagB-type dehydrogenase family enzyme